VHLDFQGLEIEMLNLESTIVTLRDIGMIEKRDKPLWEMNHRELDGLKLQEAVLVTLSYQIPSMIDHKRFIPIDVDFACVTTFWACAKDLLSRNDVQVSGIKTRRLKPHALLTGVIVLGDLERAALDTQLREYTGDGFSYSHFHNEGEEGLTPKGILVHRTTGAKFLVPTSTDKFEGSILNRGCASRYGSTL
jgi:hypothetical protein